MLVKDFATFFQICHTPDAPLHKQYKFEAAEKQSHFEKNAADKNCATAQCKTLSRKMKTNTEQDNVRFIVITTNLMGMMSCGNCASTTTGIIQTTANQQIKLGILSH